MPTYDVECPTCGTYERFKMIEDRHAPCDTCGGPIGILITSSTSSKGFEPYFDVGLGHYITGVGDRRKHMRSEHLDYRDHPAKGDQSARLDRVNEAKRREREAR